jgi:hypothetical protein
MARKRMIDPGVWTDHGFMELSPLGRLLWIGLVSQADDEGRGHGSAKSLKAAIFPCDELSIGEVEQLRSEVADHMRVVFYSVDGEDYYQLQKWKYHQSINKPSESAIPSSRSGTVVLPERSRSTTGMTQTTVALPEDYGSATDQRKKEVKKEGSAPGREETPPTDSRSWTIAWYREFSRRAARTLEPGPEAFTTATKAWKRAKPDTLIACIIKYFEHPFWFTTSKRGTAREWSFSNFIGHLDDVISQLGSGPQKAAPKLDVRRCPNGHNYVHGDVCMECGWKEPKEDDDGF